MKKITAKIIKCSLPKCLSSFLQKSCIVTWGSSKVSKLFCFTPEPFVRLYLAAAHALKFLWAWEHNILYNFCTKSLFLLWKLSLFEWLRNYGGIKDPPKNIEETARGTILKVTLKSSWGEFLQKKKDKPQICFFTNLCWRAFPKSMQNATKPFVFEGQSLKTFNLREKEATFFWTTMRASKQMHARASSRA